MTNDQLYRGYLSRKFILAAGIVTTAAAAMFTGHMTGTEFASLTGGVFTVFAGGDVAQNMALVRAGAPGRVSE